MNKNKKPFCVRYVLYVFMAGFLGQIFLPSIGACSTGASSSPTGANLVKEQLAHDTLQTPSTRLKIYVIKPGDVFCDILVKAGISRKDALYISKKALGVYKLTKMRPGSVLELYFSPDGSGLQEVDYKVSSLKKMVLYNGKVIGLAHGKLNAASTQSPQAGPQKSEKKPSTITTRQAAIPKENRKALNISLKTQALSSHNQHITKKPVSAKICTAQSNSTIVKRTMRISSSYNCGLPQSIQTTPQTQYELLASGMVLSPVLPPWDKDTLRAMLDRSGNMNDQEKASAKRQTSGKKSAPLFHKKNLAKKTHRDHIAKTSEPAFLKAPLAYRRVSSGFSYSRVDPFTNMAQPHLGIDYSAPSGTPVYSIGAGVVQFIGWDGGYGKTIRIVHANGFISQYGHLSRFAQNMIMGKRVRKGEAIGYVGMTGLATGPHLDFRITHNGTYINPVKLEDSTRKFYTKKGTGKSRSVSRG